MKITRKKALELLERATVIRGRDYVYMKDPKYSGSCQYAFPTEDGKGIAPACMVGMALAILDPDLLPVINVARTVGDLLGQSLTLSTEDETYVFTQRAMHTLRRAQIRQDGGSSWGGALDSAKGMYEQTEPRDW